MSPVRNVTEVFEAMQQAKAGASAFSTNFFPTQRKLQGWIDHGELLGDLRDGVAFFLRKDRDFWHLYFCAASLAALRREIADWPRLKTDRVMVDVIGNEATLDHLLTLLESQGFRRYRRLHRMARTTQAGPPPIITDDLPVLYADKTDCPAILELLCRSFDRYAEQLPMHYEIESAVESRQILVAKREGALGGLLFFETQGFTSTIRYWLVAEQFRAFRFGSALMRHYFAVHRAIRRFLLWVIADNAQAIEKYRHYGFTPDGLVDHVLASQGVRP